MAPSLPQRVQELTSRMLQKKLFVVTMTSTVAADRLMPYLPEHLEYMTELARKGVLFASGPILGADGAPSGDGLSIFNTATAQDARNYAEKDPFYIQGLRKIEIREWMLMEGAMRVTLNFAERRLEVE
jgi:uncharacterized protein YciI